MDDFEGFFAREHPGVLAACVALGGDVDIARETTDEAFARAFGRRKDVQVMTAPGGWVQTVALNHLQRMLRRRTFERRRAHAAVATEVLPDPELWIVVRTLPRRQQTAIVLAYVHDLPRTTIAEVMGISPGTVSSTLDAARQSLRRQLTDSTTHTEDLRWLT